MKIVSNNLFLDKTIVFPKEVVVRINIAWVQTESEIEKIISSLEREIYLDYPQGRSKPPKPILDLDTAIKLANKFKNVKHFAVSNVEDPQNIKNIRLRLNESVGLVPKIETELGVINLLKIFDAISPVHIMLDKEDLYVSVKQNVELYNHLVNEVRRTCKEGNVKLLELKGVFFA